MSEDAVVLRLSGSGPETSLEPWIQSLGRISSGISALYPGPGELPVEAEAWCERSGVTLLSPRGKPSEPDVLVIASADDLPTPGALRRLVEATLRSGVAHRARVLPCGAVRSSDDGPVTRPPTNCVVVPRAAIDTVTSATTADEAVTALTGAGVDVRLLDTAAVFTRSWPSSPPSTAPAQRSADVPRGHPAALPSTALHQLVVRAGLALPDATTGPADGPFLSVVTRTQGTRLLMLEEALTCLAAQTSRDFEVLLMCHRAEPRARQAVLGLVNDLPEWLQERIRVIDTDRPGRAAPLNDALAVARGRYVSVLDDDDTVTADWVGTFAELEVGHEGRVLRASALRQDVEPLPGPAGGDAVPLEVEPARPGWPRQFSLVDHLWDNATPFMSLAFSRGVFSDLGLRFDESLEATEDWDVLLRAATLVGVTSSSHLTSVYRTWTRAEGSREVHDATAWDAAHRHVVARLDEVPLVLPPGAVQEVRALHRALLEERAEKFRFAGLNEQAAADLRTVNEAVVVLRDRIAQLEDRLARVKRRRHPG